MGKQPLSKCHVNHPECFALNIDGKCELLESYDRPGGLLGHERRYATKFKNRDCPFAKGILEAGGTYSYLCDKYPLPPDPEDRK